MPGASLDGVRRLHRVYGRHPESLFGITLSDNLPTFKNVGDALGEEALQSGSAACCGTEGHGSV